MFFNLSANSSTHYYLGVENDSTANDTQIEIRTGTVTDGMKWKIEETSSGAYKLIPKSGESFSMVMTVKVLGSNNNNDPVKQQTYSDNTDYKDEWLLYKTGTAVMLLSIISSEGNHDHVSCFNDAIEDFASTSFNEYNIIHTDHISVTDCIAQMELSKIFISRSHGGADSTSSWLRLFDTGTASRLYSYNIYNFTTSTALVDFSGVEIMLYVGCNTAFGGNTANNLITASVNSGANFALGFKKSINCDGANTWTSYFCEYYTDGQTIYDAALNAADDTASDHFILNLLGELNTDSYSIAH